MAPTKIMIIRHAEKPGLYGETRLAGVDATGQIAGANGNKHLVTIGWQRAGSLVTLFAPPWGPRRPDLDTPQHLFASNPSQANAAENGGAGPSQRPYETLLPLADSLGLTINSDYPKNGHDRMVAAALAKTGAVLISWQHEDIPLRNKSGDPGISQWILTQTNTPASANLGIPTTWPKNTNNQARYDVIWIFDLSPKDGTVEKFTQFPQMLLNGDQA